MSRKKSNSSVGYWKISMLMHLNQYNYSISSYSLIEKKNQVIVNQLPNISINHISALAAKWKLNKTYACMCCNNHHKEIVLFIKEFFFNSGFAGTCNA